MNLVDSRSLDLPRLETLWRTSATGRAPVELIALDEPYEGVIAALARGVDLAVSADLFTAIRDDFPPQLPDYITIR